MYFCITQYCLIILYLHVIFSTRIHAKFTIMYCFSKVSRQMWLDMDMYVIYTTTVTDFKTTIKLFFKMKIPTYPNYDSLFAAIVLGTFFSLFIILTDELQRCRDLLASIILMFRNLNLSTYSAMEFLHEKSRKILRIEFKYIECMSEFKEPSLVMSQKADFFKRITSRYTDRQLSYFTQYEKQCRFF